MAARSETVNAIMNASASAWSGCELPQTMPADEKATMTAVRYSTEEWSCVRSLTRPITVPASSRP